MEFLPGPAGERALLARLAAGDEVAYRELYNTHAPKLLRVLTRMLHGDRAQAEEVLQESFVAAFRSVGTYREEGSIGAWLMRIAVRHSLNAIRGESRRNARHAALPTDTTAEPTFGERAAARRVLGLIEDLDEPKRTTMLLIAEGFGPTEIAEILGEARGTVLARISRTRADLAQRAVAEGLFDDVRSLRGER